VIVLDASVLIGFLDEDDPHHGASFEVLMSTDDYRMHTITIAEVLVQGATAGSLASLEHRLREIGIVEHPRLPTEASDLARLRSVTGLKLPDCCVLLVAVATGASLATFDAGLARAAVSQGVDLVDGRAHGDD
jgi:predicted nucleic acid-binding protein